MRRTITLNQRTEQLLVEVSQSPYADRPDDWVPDSYRLDGRSITMDEAEAWMMRLGTHWRERL